jgi:hypothetical protein
MLFKRKAKDEPAAEGRGPPGGQPRSVDEAYQALRTELGLNHLWYLELRLSEELARASRVDGVFSLCAWRPRLLPGEPLPPDVIGLAAQIIQQNLRNYDIVARIDEHRLVGLLLDARYEDATTVAFRIKGDLQVRVPAIGKWQAGIATFGRDGSQGDVLIQTVLRRLEEDARA